MLNVACTLHINVYTEAHRHMAWKCGPRSLAISSYISNMMSFKEPLSLGDHFPMTFFLWIEKAHRIICFPELDFLFRLMSPTLSMWNCKFCNWASCIMQDGFFLQVCTNYSSVLSIKFRPLSANMEGTSSSDGRGVLFIL